MKRRKKKNQNALAKQIGKPPIKNLASYFHGTCTTIRRKPWPWQIGIHINPNGKRQVLSLDCCIVQNLLRPPRNNNLM